MREVTVKKGQTMVNICMQVYGTYNLLAKLANDNSLDITTDLKSGQVLTYDPALGSVDTLSYLKGRTVINE